MRRDRRFVLSDIQSLTEVNYYMSSLYLNSLPVVNTKGVSFLALNWSSFLTVLNKLQFIVSSQLLVIIMDLIIKNPSNKELSDILHIHLSNQYPELSKKSQQALLKLLYFCNDSEVIRTSNNVLQILWSCEKRHVQRITRELSESGIIQKSSTSCDDDIPEECENSLNICINLQSISNIQFQQTEFLATYIRTQTLCVKGLMFKKALFQDVHDLDNIITIKTYEIGYDDETSGFLKKLNAGDVISFTPSINKPTIKSIKHPLNLKMHTRAETEGETFLGEFDYIKEEVHEKLGTIRCAWFKNVRNTSGSIEDQIAQVNLKPDCLNSKVLESMEKGDLIVFKARVFRITTNEGKEVVSLKDINNIMPREEYYNNYGAM